VKGKINAYVAETVCHRTGHGVSPKRLAAEMVCCRSAIQHKCNIAEEDMTGPIGCWQQFVNSGDDVQLPAGTQKQLETIAVTRVYRNLLDSRSCSNTIPDFWPLRQLITATGCMPCQFMQANSISVTRL
jgi:hypothetical protein